MFIKKEKKKGSILWVQLWYEVARSNQDVRQNAEMIMQLSGSPYILHILR